MGGETEAHEGSGDYDTSWLRYSSPPPAPAPASLALLLFSFSIYHDQSSFLERDKTNFMKPGH